MASPKSIPSKIASSPGVYTTTAPVQGKKTSLYITAILVSASDITVTIDGDDTTWSTEVVSLSSPLKCSSFETFADGQVAYYEQ